ncbi:MAG: serine/threonine-protein kinase PknK, partial [Pirellulaceae bacterium]
MRTTRKELVKQTITTRQQKLVGRYQIGRELGRGGMGVVYGAHDPLLNREVAVKLIAPSQLTDESEQRFQTEAQIVAQMDHPSIVPIYDFGHHDGSLYFVMPVVKGTSLRQFIKDQSLTLGEIIDVGVAVANALEYSHTRQVIHRDIKPENIMVSREEDGGLRVRVMDFGLARNDRVGGITKTGVFIGTMAYVSPEHVNGQAIDARSDIYSLGTVLYECIVNKVPFVGEMMSILYRIVNEIPQSLRAQSAEIDQELEELILGCLAKDPESRPSSAGELSQSLQQYKSGHRDSDQMKSVISTSFMQVQRPAIAPFAGRDEEMRELQQRLNMAVGGECQFVLISGEPGIGKSRLLDELGELGRARKFQVLKGRFVERDSAFPYHGFCEAIQEYFRQRESGSASNITSDLPDLAPDLISLFPMLGEIEAIRLAAGGDSKNELVNPARSPDNRTQIYELLARTLTRLGGGHPLILFLEDLHGAEISIEALQYIVRRLGPSPTLIVGTYRSNEVDRSHPLNRLLENFEGDRRFSSMALGPFSPSVHREFLATLIGGERIVDELADQLFEAAEGNPFFTKELVRSLLDADSIVQDDTGAWALSGGTRIEADRLPVTIQQAVENRIARLPDNLRGILSIASVIGKTFEFRDLEMLTDQDDLDESVDALVQAGLIEEERRSRGDKLTFCSGVVREVFYAELSRRKRRSLHRKYAEQLEQRHSGRLDRVRPHLVHHFAEGDIPEKAVHYGLEHARRSLDTFSSDETIRSARSALEFLDEEWQGDPAVEGDARMLLAAGLQMDGAIDESVREYETAVAVYDRLDEQSRAVDAMLAAAQAAWHGRRTE